jgi:hypothetical protein
MACASRSTRTDTMNGDLALHKIVSLEHSFQHHDASTIARGSNEHRLTVIAEDGSRFVLTLFSEIEGTPKWPESDLVRAPTLSAVEANRLLADNERLRDEAFRLRQRLAELHTMPDGARSTKCDDCGWTFGTHAPHCSAQR